jgi:hypothetical protein
MHLINNVLLWYSERDDRFYEPIYKSDVRERDDRGPFLTRILISAS